MPEGLRVGKLLLENTLMQAEDTAGWVLEGRAEVVHRDGWMEMFSPEERDHHVYWCPQRLPADFIAQWEVQNLETDAGLCIVFFGSNGAKGEDLFDPELPARDGTFKQYTNGAIDCYHISYYANAAHRPNRPYAHIRKNAGFHMVQQGKGGIPADSEKVHRLTLAKQGGHVRFWVDDRLVVDWTDIGEVGGEPYTAGYFGLRQMKWTHFRYRNLRVWEWGL